MKIALFSGLIASIVTLICGLTGGYFLYHRPQLNLLEEQIKQNIVLENYKLLDADITKKWDYAPNDPSFKTVEELSGEALDAITKRDYIKAVDKMDKARDLLRSLPGPPVTDFPTREDLFKDLK